MQLIAHRGDWTDPKDKNSAAAFRRALDKGYGIETDIRDLGGRLVISHDMPVDPELDLDGFLDLYTSSRAESMLALNIKSDGLAAALNQTLKRHGITRYFVFDMSVPDSLGYFSLGMDVFTRRSEYEGASTLDTKAQGVWIDRLSEGAVSRAAIAAELEAGRTVAIVSPELHRRPHLPAWVEWKTLFQNAPPEKVMLCTDLCDEAAAFFR